MLTDTRTLFASLIKALHVDCVCDIGSRDGDQSTLFRLLLPQAVVVAFEANPINFAKMQSNPNLKAHRIEIFPYAITNQRGTAKFHVTDVDYSDPAANKGTSSLLVHDELTIRESVEVETHRIDDIIEKQYSSVKRMALWIDVEGAEYGVLEGIKRIKDRVLVMHVETANYRMRHGQKIFEELMPLLESYGFVQCGSNIDNVRNWGDVVLVNKSILRELGWRFPFCKMKGYVWRHLEPQNLAVFLKARSPWLYHTLRRIYVKCWT